MARARRKYWMLFDILAKTDYNWISLMGLIKLEIIYRLISVGQRKLW